MLIEKFSTICNEKIKEGSIITEMWINAQHPLFEGHFPENPVTPGVMLLQLFKEQAERFTGKNLQITKASNIKFLSVIDPELNPNVRLESQILPKEDLIDLTGKALHQGKVSIKLKLIFKIVSHENN